MNINDVSAPEERPDDLLGAIFDRQRELMERYHGIEHANGLLQTEEVPVDLHCRFGQARIKDFAWRMTEEFTEATDAKDDRDHYLEELIDGLHFLVEGLIISGYQPKGRLEDHFAMAQVNSEVQPYHVIERFGCACNCLKNKPWKQSHMLTDTVKFYRHLEEAWFAFVALMKYEGLEAGDVYDLYFRKAAVNSFRQRSRY